MGGGKGAASAAPEIALTSGFVKALYDQTWVSDREVPIVQILTAETVFKEGWDDHDQRVKRTTLSVADFDQQRVVVKVATQLNHMGPHLTKGVLLEVTEFTTVYHSADLSEDAEVKVAPLVTNVCVVGKRGLPDGADLVGCAGLAVNMSSTGKSIDDEEDRGEEGGGKQKTQSEVVVGRFSAGGTASGAKRPKGNWCSGHGRWL